MHPDPLAAGKRKALQSVKIISMPRRIDAIEQHLKKQHAKKWDAYEQASLFDKNAFFGVNFIDVPQVNSLDAYAVTGGLFFSIRENIVLGVIRDYFFDHGQCQSVNTTLNIFKRDEKLQKDDEHESLGDVNIERIVTAKKGREFMLTVDSVGCGIYIRQSSSLLAAIATRTGLHKLQRVRDEDVPKFEQAVVGFNL